VPTLPYVQNYKCPIKINISYQHHVRFAAMLLHCKIPVLISVADSDRYCTYLKWSSLRICSNIHYLLQWKYLSLQCSVTVDTNLCAIACFTLLCPSIQCLCNWFKTQDMLWKFSDVHIVAYSSTVHIQCLLCRLNFITLLSIYSSVSMDLKSALKKRCIQ